MSDNTLAVAAHQTAGIIALLADHVAPSPATPGERLVSRASEHLKSAEAALRRAACLNRDEESLIERDVGGEG